MSGHKFNRRTLIKYLFSFSILCITAPSSMDEADNYILTDGWLIIV
jgi:hypothetical protein